MASPRYIPVAIREYATTADRLADTFSSADVGSYCQDNALNKLYVVRSAGSGVSCMTEVTRNGNAAVALTDGANIAVDASLGSRFSVTLGGNRTLSNPTNLVDGQRLLFQITQDGTGSRTLAYGTKYLKTGGALTLTTTAGAIDVIEFIYDAAADKLYNVGTYKAQA
jgi:hypothetical protein